MNLSYNLLTDDVVDILIDKRESLPCLRIINLSHNKINERRIKTKADELKRVGIITTFWFVYFISVFENQLNK